MTGIPIDCSSSRDIGLLRHLFPGLTPGQIRQYEQLLPLYREWNEKINVISRKDIGNLYLHHVLHSLAIAKVVSFRPGSSVLDVGTGGGFPGIPLAILFPETRFHLVDSIGKKIKVVEAVAAAAGLQNVRAEQCRAESLHASYDFIVSRAVTRLPEFYGWVSKSVSGNHQHVLPNGILYLKGGDLFDEIRPFGKRITEYRVQELYGLSDIGEGALTEADPDLKRAAEFFETKKVIYLAF